eukprot:4271267-Karenia_brevis.AAC.1
MESPPSAYEICYEKGRGRDQECPPFHRGKGRGGGRPSRKRPGGGVISFNAAISAREKSGQWQR